MCRTLAFVALSAVLAQVAFAQTIVPINSLLQNQLLLNSLGPNLVSIGSNVVGYESVETVVKTPVVSPVVKTPIVPAPCLSAPVLQAPVVSAPVVQAPVVPTTTIIQDSTVANNLANALQLLIVSNLLSNTLPYMGDVVVPTYAPAVDVVTPLAPLSLGGLTYVF